MVDDNNFSSNNNVPEKDLSKDELWTNRIVRREDALKQKAERNRWEIYIREFQGDYSDTLNTADDILPLNLIYSYVKTEIPDLYLQDPYLEFTPKKRTTIGSAKIKEMAINDLWHLKKFKREIKKAIQDGKLVSHAWLKVGYNANLGNAEEGFETTDLNIEDDYFLYRVNWRNIIFNDESVDAPYDCSWIGQKYYIPLKAAKEMKDWASTKANLMGIRLSVSEIKENKRSSNSGVVEGDVEFAELYEIWDIVNKKVLIVSKQKDVGVLHEREWPYKLMAGFPFLFLNLSFLNDEPYGISDVGMGEAIVLEKTKMRNAFLKHLKRSNRQLITKKDNFSQEAKDAYSAGDDSALLEVEDENRVKAVPYAPFASDVWGFETRLDDDLAQAWGQRTTDRAGKATTQTRTKYELQQQGAGTSNRLMDERNVIEDLVEEAAEKLSCLMEQYATDPYYVQVTGYRPEEIAEMLAKRPSATSPNAITTPYGFTFTNEDIKGPVDVKIKQSSAIPLDKQGKIELLKEMANIYVQLKAQGARGGPFIGAVAKMLVEESGLHELVIALEQEAKFEAEQSKQAQEQVAQQQELAIGQKSAEMQLKSQELATKQQKVQSDSTIDILTLIKDIQLQVAEINSRTREKKSE